MEAVAGQIIGSPALYGATLARNVYAVASQLRYCEPQKALMVDEETDEPVWLHELERIIEVCLSLFSSLNIRILFVDLKCIDLPVLLKQKSCRHGDFNSVP